MSTNTIFRAGLVTTLGVAALAVSATTNAQNSRYGNVSDYESGQNCTSPCAPAAPAATSSRYGAPVVAQPMPAPVAPVYMPAPQQAAPIYVDCSVTGTCAPTQSYQTQSYQAPAPTYSTQMQAPANCPAGTTAQPDGTCMQGGGYDSYSSGSTTSYGSTSSYGTTTMSAPADCPAGTTAQSDGTCMQGGGGSSYTGSTVELYTGDASTTSDSTYGYTSDGAYGPTDYLPIRK